MRIVTLSISLLLSIGIYNGCVNTEETHTPTNSSEDSSPSVVAMNDTSAYPGDSFYIHAKGFGGDGEVTLFLWALDGINFNDTSADSLFKVSFSPTFATILVKVINDKNDTSFADTVTIIVSYVFPDPISAEGFVQLGNREKIYQDFEKALEYYTLATELDPQLADGWYLKAEMELRVGGVVLPDLINELQNKDPSKLPFFPDETLDSSILWYVYSGADYIAVRAIDTLYDRLAIVSGPVFKAYFDLQNIIQGVAYKGLFTRERIRLDVVSLSNLYVVLRGIDQIPKDSILTSGYSPLNLERELFKVLSVNEEAWGTFNFDTTQLSQFLGNGYDINQNITDIINSATISLSIINELDAEIKASSASGIDTTMMEAPKALMNAVIEGAEAALIN